MAPQDSFLDEDDECCPLCVEEFDLSDRNFRPCPCGYQVCQFCFHNIKNNMNGLCPACRRPYDEKTMEYKAVTPEEIAQFKANVQKNAKKKAEQRQKEAQKREVESLNRKHLSGLRVVQKNLVYVVGLSPGIREADILQTLRGDKYFGQYGKILKIVVSKTKQGDANNQSLGVYVTFERKEDAAKCINAVDGSRNGDRILRAQFGTTKYCSAYLRNEACTNKQCMFLHEPGDNDDSYSRQDLSSINSVSTQRPLSAVPSSSRQSMQAPVQQAPVAAAAQPLAREGSKDGSDNGDSSALPSSASWANRGLQQRSRRGSHATSGTASSPAVSHAMPAPAETLEDVTELPPNSSVSGMAAVISVSDAHTSSEAVRPDKVHVLLDLLRSINSPVLTSSGVGLTNELSAPYSFPPLFDDRGGEKRKAMREQQEDLHIDHEPIPDLQNSTQSVEEEEPESGSFQLGGEPEDGDGGRGGNLPQGFQQRHGGQLPIQRASNGGLFGAGPGQNFAQNLNNLSSINGRSLTPFQQHQLMQLKSNQSQPSFMDQFPPGIGNPLSQGSTVFQQQGHNRQSSRYSFANESSSSPALAKPSANPKLMAQQTSMMPSGSHGHQGSQFYGSSMPGPPPGLKSSGTPPIGGSMFGQGHAFGNAVGGGSGFGGVLKDGSNDMFRELHRGRGSAGSSQSHDTGKREFMFPSFLQQYPSASSTPAPASGLLASLYGSQPGAFHDYGQKQKKKGKKHRHANTSSSGGGGLVDLADPSILQARMQHQQQSNAGVGQGLFGGQRGGYNPSMMYDDQGLLSLDEATLSVDALVADSTADDFDIRNLPPLNVISRSSTPSAPPGFDLPHAHPTPAERSLPNAASTLPSRIVPTSAPFTPSRSASAFVPRTPTPLTNVSVVTTPSQAPPSSTTQANSVSKAREAVRASATKTGLSKSIASQTSVTPVALAPPVTPFIQVDLQSEEFPALGKGFTKSTISVPSAKSIIKPTTTTGSHKKLSVAASGTSVIQTQAQSDKRSTPGILSVPLSSQVSSKDPADATSPAPTAASFPPLPPTTPSTTSLQSPLPKPAPKTLRVLPTPKTETTNPVGSATPSSATSAVLPTISPSRQPSLASISRLERPGTPSSEIISDNASVTSASASRANSPPPTKVGSAPVRMTTKSMQKKQRKEAQKVKEKTETEVVPPKAEAEIEVAPIMGRKKKQKKEKTIGSVAGGSTPAASRPPSPVRDEPLLQPETLRSTVQKPSEAAGPLSSQSDKSDKSAAEPKSKGKVRANRAPSPETTPTIPEIEPELSEKPSPTPASILQELVSMGLIKDASGLSMLKNPSINFRHPEPSIHLLSATTPKLNISPEERTQLLAGKPVRQVEGSSRVLLTPHGDCVRNLTFEEEERYLELQARMAKDAGPAAFLSAKHQASAGFTLVGGRAVPNGPPSFFPQAKGSGTAIDPITKIHRDEMLNHINQYLVPSLNLNSYLGKALDTNTLNAEILRSGDSSTWAASWGSELSTEKSRAETVVGESSYSAHHHQHEGILDSGLANMTAHFTTGSGNRDDRGQALGNVTMLSIEDAETAMQLARKEAEALEKRLSVLVKKNRRLLLSSGH